MFFLLIDEQKETERNNKPKNDSFLCFLVCSLRRLHSLLARLARNPAKRKLFNKQVVSSLWLV